MINKETTIKKDIIYSGKIVTLELHEVKTDLGNHSRREIIRHAAGVVILGYTGYYPGSMEFLGEALTSPGYSDEVLYIYRAKDLREDPLDGDADESFEYFEMTPEEVTACIRSGELKDAKSLCALYLDGLMR